MTFVPILEGVAFSTRFLRLVAFGLELGEAVFAAFFGSEESLELSAVDFDDLDQTKIRKMFRNSLPRAAFITKTDNDSLCRLLGSGDPS